MTTETSDEVVSKGPCPNTVECGSSDAFATYGDGHGHCFSCGHHVQETDVFTKPERKGKMNKPKHDFLQGEARDLPKRKLTETTCQKWGYVCGEMNDKSVQIANYRDDNGSLVAQKVRFANKDFTLLGDAKNIPLYGQHLWRDKGKKVVVTEGEIDALSVSQVQQNKWPVVSLPNGAQGAKKALARALEWLEGFEEVILMFDDDEPGRKAVAECAPLFTPGKCKVGRIAGFKDANEALQAGQGAAIIDAIWGAKTYRPDGVISIDDLREELRKPIVIGDPWPWPELTEWTYGRRPGEVYALGAGTGVGKTDVFTQIIAHDVVTLKKKCGVLYLEQPPVETARRIAGKLVGKRFHIPGVATPEELDDALKMLEGTGRLFFYDHFGSSEWDTVKSRIRYMVQGLGCEHVFLDHLTALAAGEEDEKKALDKIMAELAGQAQELGHKLHFISHLATPEGKPHEEGGRVMIRHFRGSRSIGFWSHFMFGLERNQQAEDIAERSITTLRCLKDRNTGAATGKTLLLTYSQDTGMLSVQANPFGPEESGEPNGDF
jgi:twinkle protein